MDGDAHLDHLLAQVYPRELATPPTASNVAAAASGHSHSHSTMTRPPTKPFVTLTWAQSIDGKISGHNGHQVVLSGKQSMLLTHKYSFSLSCSLSSRARLLSRSPAMVLVCSYGLSPSADCGDYTTRSSSE